MKSISIIMINIIVCNVNVVMEDYSEKLKPNQLYKYISNLLHFNNLKSDIALLCQHLIYILMNNTIIISLNSIHEINSSRFSFI